MVEATKSRRSGSAPARQAAMVPTTAVRREEALFTIMEKLVRSAANSTRQGNFKNAATHLKRAHQIASKQAAQGLVAGRVARASIGVQYCALLSRSHRHAQALNEALAAVMEAEEALCLVTGGSTEVSPLLTRRAVCAVVQAKHCVAIELEYSLSQESPDAGGEAAPVREQIIPTLHQEAAILAAQWLPPGHPVRELSERTEAQAVARRTEAGATGAVDDPWGLGQTHESPEAPRPAESPVLQVLPDKPDVSHAPELPAAEEILPEGGGGGKGSRPASAHSVLSRPSSAVKLQRLEDQALHPPEDARLQTDVLEDLPAEIPRTRGSVLWDTARERVFSRGSSKAYTGSRAGSKSAFGDRRRRYYAGDDGYDIFREWAQKNMPKSVKGSVSQRIATEAGFVELKLEMQTRSRHFHMQEIPRFTAEDLYENKVLFSDYGVKVRNQAYRKEEKVAASTGRSTSRRRAAHNDNVRSVKTLTERLNESHANSQMAKEFFSYLYGARKHKTTHDIFESLRQAYHSKVDGVELP